MLSCEESRKVGGSLPTLINLVDRQEKKRKKETQKRRKKRKKKRGGTGSACNGKERKKKRNDTSLRDLRLTGGRNTSFSTGHCSPHRGTPFQVQGLHKWTALSRGCDYEEGRLVAN